LEFRRVLFRSKISDFNGFIYEENFSIKDIVNYNYNELNFTETIFIKEALFDNYTFKGKIIFNYTNFLEFTTFINSKFLYSTVFNNVIFNKKYSKEKVFIVLVFKV